MADRGANVVGIDLSAKLLAIARRHEVAKPRGVAYVQADARDLAAVADATFDGIVCFMALMDIPDLAPTLLRAPPAPIASGGRLCSGASLHVRRMPGIGRSHPRLRGTDRRGVA